MHAKKEMQDRKHVFSFISSSRTKNGPAKYLEVPYIQSCEEESAELLKNKRVDFC